MRWLTLMCLCVEDRLLVGQPVCVQYFESFVSDVIEG